MNTITKTDEEIEVDTANGETYEVMFHRETSSYVDHNYGADADGNRGVSATFIDSDTVSDIRVKVADKYVSILEIGDTERIQIEEAINAWMEVNDAEIDSCSVPEDDDDRDR